LKNVVY